MTAWEKIHNEHGSVIIGPSELMGLGWTRPEHAVGEVIEQGNVKCEVLSVASREEFEAQAHYDPAAHAEVLKTAICFLRVREI